MSKCNTCEYALYDGMCMAQGKFTVLDADSCGLYKPTQDSEVARLKVENAKLRELVKAMEPFLCCMPFASCNTLAANVRERMRELGLEVKS